jgi:hypothetical protein
MPRFRIISEDGRSIRVEDTVTGQSLKTSRIEVVKERFGSPLIVSIDFIDEDFALDIAAGEMRDVPADDEADEADEPEETPKKRQTLS